MDTQNSGTNPFWGSTSGQSAPETSDTGSNPYWNTPQDVKNAQADVGNQDDKGLCQKFVEQAVYGKTGIFPSAVVAWNTYAQNGTAKEGTEGIKRGDLVYFSPNRGNGNNGHVGIYQGDGKFISATYNGVESNDLTNWQKQTGQSVLGYVPMK